MSGPGDDVEERDVALSGKRIFMTGGAGFMGTTLAKRLVDDNEIVVLDNLRRDALTDTPLAEHPNLSFHHASVLDADLVKELAQGATHFVHLAAIAGVDHVLKDPVETMRVNLIGTYNALEAALATQATLERFIDISTSEVFGARAYRVEETHDTPLGSVGEARWTYAVSKLAGEYLAHAYYDKYALPATAVRPFNVYGPRQVARGAMMAFIEAAVAGRDLVIHGDGSQIRAWCYVDDMVEALMCVLEREEAVGEVFNVGNARSVVTVVDLAQRVIRVSGSSSRLVFRPLHYKDVEMRIPNVDKARRLLGWDAQVDLDEGLARTIAWYGEQERTPAPAAAG
jgi:UDP-glucose 4-epimerase